jgi:nitroreductase
MADNYLEKRYEETLGSAKPKVKRIGHTVDELLRKNRSTRGYHKPYVVKDSELRRIIEVCTKIPSACNQQVLRFLPVTKECGADKVLELIKMGAALPELHLPFPGTEPEAFIICCSTVKETPLVDMDLGIAAQSMLLKAVEMGLNGLIIGAFNREKLKEAFALPHPPVLVLAIGKGAETIELTPIGEAESHAYYRRDGVHYVPKVRLDDLIIKRDA